MKISDLYEGRTPLIEKLRVYGQDADVFVSFTDILKLGINPQSEWTDPLGIYAYPVREMLESFENKIVPFAGERKYAYLIHNNGNMIELHDYTEHDLDRDLDILQKKFFQMLMAHPDSGTITDPQAHWEANLMQWYDQWAHNPGLALWRITKRMTNYIVRRFSNREPAVVWNLLLRTLGYDGLVDRGQKIISTNEPAQAVFLNTRAFRVIEACPNDILKIIR